MPAAEALPTHCQSVPCPPAPYSWQPPAERHTEQRAGVASGPAPGQCPRSDSVFVMVGPARPRPQRPAGNHAVFIRLRDLYPLLGEHHRRGARAGPTGGGHPRPLGTPQQDGSGRPEHPASGPLRELPPCQRLPNQGGGPRGPGDPGTQALGSDPGTDPDLQPPLPESVPPGPPAHSPTPTTHRPQLGTPRAAATRRSQRLRTWRVGTRCCRLAAGNTEDQRRAAGTRDARRCPDHHRLYPVSTSPRRHG